MIADYDQCPNCGERRLPAIPDDSHQTARRCQSCGLVFERSAMNAAQTPVFKCPSCGRQISQAQWNAFEGTCAGCATAIAELPE